MKSLMLGAALALVALAAEARQVPHLRDPLPTERVVTRPEWETIPDVRDLEAFYPPLARIMAAAGRAVVRCSVTATGDLAGCQAVEESPQGLGFGSAAVTMASRFHMKPATVNGVPVDGGTVTLPLVFDPKTGAPPLPPPAAVDPRPPASPQTIQLARRLVAARRETEAYGKFLGAFRDKMRAGRADAPEPDEAHARAHKIAVEAIDEAFQASLARFAEAEAELYAQRFSEAELRGLVAFNESPVGAAWNSRDISLADERLKGMYAAGGSAQDQAKETFCKRVTCP